MGIQVLAPTPAYTQAPELDEEIEWESGGG